MKPVVFDIETYYPDWRIERTRREGFDPARNTIIMMGLSDGKELHMTPIIDSLEEERAPVEFFLSKLTDFKGPLLLAIIFCVLTFHSWFTSPEQLENS